MFRKTAAAALLLCLTHLPVYAGGGLETLAQQGRWPEILEIAQRREAQLPVTGIQALVAAEAARHSRESELRRRYLEAAVDDATAGPVARVELAELLIPKSPERSIELVLPLFAKAPSRQLRGAAARVSAQAVAAGVSTKTRSRLRRELRRLSGSSRRLLETELAMTGKNRRRELQNILRADRTDLADLRAAELLSSQTALTARERWLVARAFYRHARYSRALHFLEGLTTAARPGVSLWRARYLRGRCAFRAERWHDAVSWYRKAQAAARRREDRAGLLVHEARALELAGKLAAAANRAKKALATRASDERRLFLARLELARGHRRTAAQLLSGLRRTTARDRGLILRAVDAHARDDNANAMALLSRVKGRVWRGPALVLAARAAVETGKLQRAASFLESASSTPLNGFWALAARQVASALPPATRQRWSTGLRVELATGSQHLRKAVQRWAPLATDPEDRRALRRAAAEALGLRGEPSAMTWRGLLAKRLWESGLGPEAGRWDPGGFPRTTSFEATWSARQLLLAGEPSWAIRLADSALQRLGAHPPADIIPLLVQRRLFPLPYPGPVAEAAGRHGIPWVLLAAVVREESRWNPEALSAVGARGLTQMMPETARSTALRAHLESPSADDLFRPTVSLRLGAAELARLLEVFGGRRDAAVAAYNAGEPQTRLWLRMAGPSSADPWFVAAIGFNATRSYTSDVLWAAQAYGEIWKKLGARTDRGSGPEAGPTRRRPSATGRSAP